MACPRSPSSLETGLGLEPMFPASSTFVHLCSTTSFALSGKNYGACYGIEGWVVCGEIVNTLLKEHRT